MILYHRPPHVIHTMCTMRRTWIWFMHRRPMAPYWLIWNPCNTMPKTMKLAMGFVCRPKKRNFHRTTRFRCNTRRIWIDHNRLNGVDENYPKYPKTENVNWTIGNCVQFMEITVNCPLISNISVKTTPYSFHYNNQRSNIIGRRAEPTSVSKSASTTPAKPYGSQSISAHIVNTEMWLPARRRLQPGLGSIA